MRLRNPGPIQPAPRLAGHLASLARLVEGWPGIEAYTHWRLGAPGVVDGAEYHVGEFELGHIHLDGTAHILFNRELASLLESKGFGQTPSWSEAWITHPVRSPSQVHRSSQLFRLAYARAGVISDQKALDRIALELDLDAF